MLASAGVGSPPSFSLTNLAANVSGQVKVTQDGFGRNRATGIWSANMTLTNTSLSAITGPVQVVLTSLTSGVIMTNKTATFNGSPFDGSPYITVSVGNLPPGAAVTVSIQFTNPSNGFINYTPVTYSGGLP
jgi:sulfur-oxidizing protein SoxB